MSKVCVVGLGYIGLPTAAMLASQGHEVIGCDISDRVVRLVNSGQAHFQEPDLDMLLAAAVQTGRLKAVSKPEAADFFIIAVPTPFMEGNKPDLSFVTAAVDSIAPYVEAGCSIILESTSPVGTTEMIASRIKSARTDINVPAFGSLPPADAVYFAHCPERILPGNMVKELVQNDRIVGGLSEECHLRVTELYDCFVKGVIHVTDCRTAELTKLIENAYRDVNIAFANELSFICDKLSVDVWKTIELANRHPRVNILQPGAGVGGHCIAVDPWFIVDCAPDEAQLIRTARLINDKKRDYVACNILRHAERFRIPIIACYGITYKPDVDDVRESPSVEIIRRLLVDTEAHIRVCDPWLSELPSHLRNSERVSLVSEDVARRDADIIAFLVGHRQFRRLDRRQFLNKVVIDAIGLMSH